MVDYSNTTATEIFASSVAGIYILRTQEEIALVWVESVSTEKTWMTISKWYNYLQSGTASLHYPDPNWQSKPGRKPITLELLSLLIEEIDADFEIERGRFPADDNGVRWGPAFNRLSNESRLAFAQELSDVILTTQEIKETAQKLIAYNLVYPVKREEWSQVEAKVWP